jgi:excisionase family DNA binding protein
VTLLEANARKARFLERVAADFPNVTVVRGRAEEQEPDSFGVAVAKALASPSVAAGSCLRAAGGWPTGASGRPDRNLKGLLHAPRVPSAAWGSKKTPASLRTWLLWKTGQCPLDVRWGSYSVRMQLDLEAATRSTLSAQQAAEQLGVAERTVRRWIASGQLPAEKTGRSFAIRIEDLERVLGPSVRRRIAVRAEERERDLAEAALNGKIELLERMYARVHDELVAAHAEIARLQQILDLQEKEAA